MKQKIEKFNVKVHPCALVEPAPIRLEVNFNGKSYSLHFYVNDVGRYVALCNTVGCQDAYGESANWWMAANECMNKVLKRK